MNRISMAILGVIALWIGYDSFFVVQEGEQAVVTRFGEFRRSVLNPGLFWKTPLSDTVQRMQKRIISSDVPVAEYLTLDKKRLVADPVTRWKIVDPLTFFKSVRDESGAKARINDIVNSELRGEIASHDFGAIIGTRRDPLMDRVAANARKLVRAFGIELVDVRIKRADLPEEVQESVFQRMQAERSRIAKRYRSEGHEEAAKIRAETDREKAVLLAESYKKSQELRGEGDAKSTSIYAASLGKDSEFYAFTRSLEAYEVGITAKTKVVLSTDSDLLKFMSSER